MSVLIICLFVASFLPLLAKFPVGYAQNKLNGYDNNHPRAQQAKLEGFGARALAAHKNAYESLITFLPALVLAVATANTSELIQHLAIGYIISRLIYNVLYLMNIGALRSLVWGISFACSASIIWQCIP